MKYFITESNFRKAFKIIPPESEDSKYIKDLLTRDIASSFGNNEITNLASAKAALEILQDIDKFKIHILKNPINNRKKTNPKTRLVYLSGNPAYHSTDKCQKIHAEYKNFLIPVEIPMEKIEEYRKFFLENIQLFNEKKDIFFARVEMKFKVVIQNVKEIEIRNSGIESIDDFEIKDEKELLNSIYLLGSEMVQFRFSSDERRKAINKYGYASHLIVSKENQIPISDEDLVIIKIWYKYKIDMKDRILKYLYLKLNPDMAFDKTCLDYLGFKPCSECLPDANDIQF